MNAKRIAELLRELANAFEEPAAQPANDSVAKPALEPRPITDVDKARARAKLRKLGML